MSQPAPSAEPAAPPPAVQLFPMIASKFVSRPLYVAAQLRLPDLLRDGPKGVDELAAATGTHAPSLYRMLRALASVGVFAAVPGDGRRFAQTPLSALLVDEPGSLRGMALWLGDPRHDRAWYDLFHSVQTGEPALERAFGASLFEVFEAEPDLAAIFHDAMTSLAMVAHRAVAQAYDFSEVSRVVDVGGGHGRLLLEVLARNPHLSGVVFDLPPVVEGARRAIAEAGLAGRCSAEAGSFFDGVPAGADAYLLSFVLHDWDDERAAAILRRCREAMAPSGRVLVSEGLVSEDPGPSLHKLLDLEMLVMTGGGRERTEAEFAELFRAAGLRLVRVVPHRRRERGARGAAGVGPEAGEAPGLSLGGAGLKEMRSLPDISRWIQWGRVPTPADRNLQEVARMSTGCQGEGPDPGEAGVRSPRQSQRCPVGRGWA